MKQLENMKRQEHGSYTEVANEKEFLKITTSTQKVICHFYHKDFRRCAIVDKHMQIVSQRHFQTKFVKIDATQCHFLVEKLAIKMLPCVICLNAGHVVDR